MGLNYLKIARKLADKDKNPQSAKETQNLVTARLNTGT